MTVVIFGLALFCWFGVMGLIHALNKNHGRHIDLFIKACDRQECINSDLWREIESLKNRKD